MVGRPPLVCFKVEIDLSVPSKRVSTISTPKVADPPPSPRGIGAKRNFNNPLVSSPAHAVVVVWSSLEKAKMSS